MYSKLPTQNMQMIAAIQAIRFEVNKASVLNTNQTVKTHAITLTKIAHRYIEFIPALNIMGRPISNG